MQKKTSVSKALLRKYPEQVVLVTAARPEGGANIMAVGWIAIASSTPPMFVLGIDDQAYTYELIKNMKEFVVAFPSEQMGKAVLYAGSKHGNNCDKLAESGLGVQPASKIKAPLISGAVANFECKLVDIYRPGDCPLITGEVVAAHENAKSDIMRLYTVGSGHKLGGVRPVQKKYSSAENFRKEKTL